MLWLWQFPAPVASGSFAPEQGDTAVVVTTCEGSTPWILCCNHAAEREGLQAPMNYTVALAIHPGLAMLNRKITAEQTALDRLAGWAYQFSSTIIVGEIHEELQLARTACLWLEIGASLNLFNSFRKFA